MSAWTLSSLFIIPFVVFVILPKIGPFYRKIQQSFCAKRK